MWRGGLHWFSVCGLGLALATACAPITEPPAPAAAVPEIASPTAAAPVDQGVNVAQAAGLAGTERIEVLELRAGDTVSYVAAVSFDDAATVQAWAAALDVALPLQPGLRCPDQYQIRFYLADGTMQQLGYFCADPLAYLRGEAISAEGQAVAAPPAFAQLFAEQVAQAK